MSRTRNLKPGFFKNEELCSLAYPLRLLYEGLWTLADREGRLEDRPKRIKIEILPYDNEDIDAHLDTLHNAGFIIRYSNNGNDFISIPTFLKHQKPHQNEVGSQIPKPVLPRDQASRAKAIVNRALTLNLDPLTLNTLSRDPGSLNLGQNERQTSGIVANPPASADSGPEKPPPPDPPTDPPKKAVRFENEKPSPKPETQTAVQDSNLNGPPSPLAPLSAILPAVVEGKGIHAVQTPAAPDSAEFTLMRRALVLYVDGKLPPPDDDLVRRVLTAGNGASANRIFEYLRILRQNGATPHNSNGPKGWGWFPHVVRAKFATKEQTG